MIFNSLTRTKCPLPSNSLITLYVCGPTVYDSAHVGHGRTYTLFDAMVRVMRRVFNKQVIYGMNITDVDDKILKRCSEMKIPTRTLTKQIEKEFFDDMEKLGNSRPTVIPRATQYIQDMVSFIGHLHRKGLAYTVDDGSIYLDTQKAQQLVTYPSTLGSGRSLSSNNEQESDKRYSSDFALWKGAKPPFNSNNETWDASPYGGRGRPGWHLECSAMIDATLGKVTGNGTIDIHGGGKDLCFPHHENERCQSELRLHGTLGTDQPWSASFWHTGHVTVDSTKMSKSLGNFSTLRSLWENGLITPRQLRLLFLSSARYGSDMEWNQGSLDRVKALDYQFETSLSAVKHSSVNSNEENEDDREEFSRSDIDFIKQLASTRASIDIAFADDFDFPRIFEDLQKICRELARRSLTKQRNYLDKEGRELIRSTLDILGFEGMSHLSFDHEKADGEDTSSIKAGDIMDDIVKFRSTVRNCAKGGDIKGIFKACDEFRQNSRFAVIQDLKDGSSIWRWK